MQSNAVHPRPGLFRTAARWWRAPASEGRQAKATRKTNTRGRIAAWAIGLSLIAGAIQLFLPLDDFYRAVRSLAQLHPADKSIVVVAVDDRSLNALGVSDPRRSDDARVVDRLFALGVRRVFFDRAYADPTSWEEDRQLVASFERHRGKVFIGAAPQLVQSDGSIAELLPHPRFRSSAEMVSLIGNEGPLGLSALFPTSSVVSGRSRPSMSAALAGFDRPGEHYRLDFSTDYKTIPTVSFIDVLRGRADPNVFAGRDVVVSPSSRSATDFHPVPLRESKAPGVYFHVIGAETLKAGMPRDLGWMPTLAFAWLVVLVQAAKRRPSRRISAGATAVLLGLPIGLDLVRTNVDIMAALLCLGVGLIRLHRLAKTTYHGETDLRRIEELHGLEVAPDRDVIALKIRNFATISAVLSPAQIDELLAKAQAMLVATEPHTQFAFHKDTFVWTRARLSVTDLEGHARGLHALFRTSIAIGNQASDLASSIGLDTNHDAPLRERTESAIQSAEDAAHAGRIFMVSENRGAEDRAWRLQILSEFETAIANDEVDVAFQPKVSLATGRIIGAEALLRWTHPVRGPIEPAQLVASAEEHNRVDQLTRFVLNRSLRLARAALARDPSFTIAINISALDLRDPMFAPQVEHFLNAYRFPPANVILEITETAPIENDETVAASMRALKQLGLKLSVDDFGSGHASLHYLRQIPADEVKIDRSFVVGMDSSLEDQALVRASIEMIHSLGRTAIAEGVESAAVAAKLREMGCDAAQGYYFERPQTMDVLVSKLTSGAIAA